MLPTPLRELLFPPDLFQPERSREEPADDGVLANARLTALLGSALIVALVGEGITLLNTRGWMTWHAGLGVLVGVLVAAKLGSTGFRLLRYYTRHGAYVAAGPPKPVMRILAPLLVLATLLLLGTGLLTLYDGGSWRFVHKLVFFAWIALAALHVGVYVWRLPRMILAPRGRNPQKRQAPVVVMALAGCALVASLTVALWFVGVMPAWPR